MKFSQLHKIINKKNNTFSFYFFISYPFICGIVVFECSSKEKNHTCALSAVVTLTNASVQYDGSLGSLVTHWII